MAKHLAASLAFAMAIPGFAAAFDFGTLTPIERLGRQLFFEQRLSVNKNQACAACHAPAYGWTGPDSAINATGSVYEGSVPGRFGDRKPPASAYAGESPLLHVTNLGTWVGGMFWDGRATGWTLGDPLAEQAQGPFLNPLEQALPTPSAAVSLVCGSWHRFLFVAVWGAGACDGDVSLAYERVARSIAAYERSREVNPFSSKYDAFLAGRATLSEPEARGRALFDGKGRCSACHPSAMRAAGKPPLLTDFTYDNLGVPKNPLNPFYYEKAFNPQGTAFVDLGLGGFLKAAGHPASIYEPQLGKFKVPSLRNVDLRPGGLLVGRRVKAYGHNGYFKSLKEIVHFYNTRDVPGAGWPAPEYEPTVNRAELGNLGLTDAEEDDLVAFLKTLSDGFGPSCFAP